MKHRMEVKFGFSKEIKYIYIYMNNKINIRKTCPLDFVTNIL